MASLRALAALLLVIIRPALPGPSMPDVAAQPPSPVSLGVKYIDLTLSATGKTALLLVDTVVTNTTTEMLRPSTSNIALIDSDNNVLSPQSYTGPGALKIPLLSPNGHADGLLLFALRPDRARSVQLVYFQKSQTPDGMTHTPIVARTPPLTPPSRPTAYRVYATAAFPLLQMYLVDEALVAGYIRATVYPLLANGADVVMPGAVRSRLQHLQDGLGHDSKAFDAVQIQARDPKSQALKKPIDMALGAIAADIVASYALRRHADWLSWQATFDADNNTLASLYQSWPGGQ